jgi:DNA-binding transcriptional ArsR family regulator
MTELLDRIHAEIRERLEARRPAAEEYERLTAALAALGPPPRAPHGASRAALLSALAERSGLSVAELSEASGVGRPAIYALLSRLVEQGEIVKEGDAYSLPRAVEPPVVVPVATDAGEPPALAA